MTAISASTVNLKTLADGTLRISFDFEPKDAQDAFRLFASPGTAVAIAALKDGHGVVSDKPETPKGGALAKLAGMWCNDPKFWQWLETDPENSASSERGAAACVHAICDVQSRAQLDHDPVAARTFQKHIREPYMEWLKSNP